VAGDASPEAAAAAIALVCDSTAHTSFAGDRLPMFGVSLVRALDVTPLGAAATATAATAANPIHPAPL
jgi:hypothetical protein